MAFFFYSDTMVVKTPVVLSIRWWCAVSWVKRPQVSDWVGVPPLALVSSCLLQSSNDHQGWIQLGRIWSEGESCDMGGGLLGYGRTELCPSRSLFCCFCAWLWQQFLCTCSTETVISRGGRHIPAQPSSITALPSCKRMKQTQRNGFQLG